MSKKQSKKVSPEVEATKEEVKKSSMELVILNRTNQKQVVEHNGNSIVFTAGEKKRYTENVEDVLESFKYYIDNNILKQIK